jgi:hypothetical protein
MRKYTTKKYEEKNDIFNYWNNYTTRNYRLTTNQLTFIKY